MSYAPVLLNKEVGLGRPCHSDLCLVYSSFAFAVAEVTLGTLYERGVFNI